MLRDNDPAGVTNAARDGTAFARAGLKVKLVMPPDIPVEGDVFDYFERAGPDKESLKRAGKDLMALVKVTNDYVPPNEEPAPAVAVVGSNDPASAEEGDEEEPASDIPRPELDEAAYHGPLGKAVKFVARYTEAAPAGILFSALTMFGARIGRGTHYLVGATRHGVNLFTLLVGTTSAGRKGSGVGAAELLLAAVDEDFSKHNVTSGLSSGQGIIKAVRDPEPLPVSADSGGPAPNGTKTRERDLGVDDKRLCVSESEYGSALRQKRGQENTQSHVLRQAWDGGQLRTMTRHDPLRATGAHISLLAQITPGELCDSLERGDWSNGFVNRHLICHVHRAQYLPHAEAVPKDQLAEITAPLRAAMPLYPDVDRVMKLDAAGAELYGRMYNPGGELDCEHPGRIGDATARGAPYVLRLAMIYAVFDQSAEITPTHLTAALEVWRYSVASALYYFGDDVSPDARRILAALTEAAAIGLTLTQIRRDVFKSNNAETPRIKRALDELRRARVAFPASEASETGTGRKRIVWRLTRYTTHSVPVGNMGKMGKEETASLTAPDVISHFSHISHGVNGDMPRMPNSERGYTYTPNSAEERAYLEALAARGVT